MAFKTKEEMFGDGGGFGPQVPFSTTNAPGTGAGNRGIEFGEQLTAAIANRPHYALALNDEEFNTRIADFETRGLDAAYDGGTVGPAGAGRTVVKDSGAVEVISSHVAVTGDSERDIALIRANSMDDDTGIAIGFEFLTQRVGTQAQVGDDAFAGFLDRRVFAPSSGLTVLTRTPNATLNPGGALANVVRVSTGNFHTGGSTDLSLGCDLAEISDSSSYDGLYIIGDVDSADTDVQLTDLAGNAAAFAADTACKVTVWRVRFSSGGGYAANRIRDRYKAVTMVGTKGAESTLDLVRGGSAYPLRILKNNQDSNRDIFTVDRLGRVESTTRQNDYETDAEKHANGGAYAVRRLIDSSAGDYETGFVVDSSVVGATMLSFASFKARNNTSTTPSLSSTLEFNYTANSDSTGELEITSSLPTEWWQLIPQIGAILEINDNTAYVGTYVIYATDTSPNTLFVKKLNGGFPAHFPTTGSGSGQWRTMSAIGWNPTSSFSYYDPFASTSRVTTISNILSSGASGNTSALITAVRQDGSLVPASTGATRHIICLSPSENSQTIPDVVFSVNALGKVQCTSLETSGDLLHSSTQTRKRVIPITSGITPDTTGFIFFPNTLLGYWLSDVAASPGTHHRLFFPLNAYLPATGLITDFDVSYSWTGNGGVRMLLMSRAMGVSSGEWQEMVGENLVTTGTVVDHNFNFTNQSYDLSTYEYAFCVRKDEDTDPFDITWREIKMGISFTTYDAI